MVLEKGGERVLFIRPERKVPAGDSWWSDKFYAMRLVPGRGTPRGNKAGAVGLYTVSGWKLVDDVLPEGLPKVTLTGEISYDIKMELEKMSVQELAELIDRMTNRVRGTTNV